jgi:hypothetical protein
MRVLELFCGTKSFTKVAKARGHETFTIDIEPKFEPDLVADIGQLKVEDLPVEMRHPDVVWASPPCTYFSIAPAGFNWKGKGSVYYPKTQGAKEAVELTKHTLMLIRELAPDYYIIENPRGFLRCMPFMRTLTKRRTAWYCSYGDPNCKPTDLWTNLVWSPLPHRSGHKANWNVRGYPRKLRAIVPSTLCEEIIIACEKAMPQTRENDVK